MVLCWQNRWMPVGSPHFPMGCNESKGWFGSASTKSLLHHSSGAVYGAKGMMHTWEDRSGGKANPFTRTGMGPAVGVHSQTENSGLCFVLQFFPLYIIFDVYLIVVLCVP